MKNNFFKKGVFAAIAVSIVFTACENSPYPGYEMSESGLFTKFYKHDENGVTPKVGDVVQLSLIVKNHKDSILTNSKDPKYNNPGKDYYEFPLMESEFNGSMEEALQTMAAGDSASFLISVDSMYKGKDLPPFLAKGTMLTYEVALRKITPKAEAEALQKKKQEEFQRQMDSVKNEELANLEKYLADNKITTTPTSTGLYYMELKKGKGEKLKMGDKIKVNYTGRFLDGSVFDTSDEKVAKEAGVYQDGRPYGPVEFTVGGLIPGFNEAMMMMNPGTKAKLIIPSAIGYGDGGGQFPPYETLVFDVELENK